MKGVKTKGVETVKTERAAPSGSVVPIESAQEGQLAALVAALSEAPNGLRRQT